MNKFLVTVITTFLLLSGCTSTLETIRKPFDDEPIQDIKDEYERWEDRKKAYLDAKYEKLIKKINAYRQSKDYAKIKQLKELYEFLDALK